MFLYEILINASFRSLPKVYKCVQNLHILLHIKSIGFRFSKTCWRDNQCADCISKTYIIFALISPTTKHKMTRLFLQQRQQYKNTVVIRVQFRSQVAYIFNLQFRADEITHIWGTVCPSGK